MLPFGPFRPDAADTNQGLLADVLNASLKPDGQGVAYGPLASFLSPSTATALPAAPKGYLTAVTSAGVYVNFILTSTAIYKLNTSGVPTLIGSGYNLPTGDRWSTAQFGTKAIFTNTTDGMLEYDIEGGGAVTAISGAPRARVVRVVFDVLFAADCDGDNKLLRNSDFNYANWTTGVQGYQPEPNGEELVGVEEIVDGFAVVLQRNAVRGIQRIADASLYVHHLLAANVGAVNPWCIVPVNGAVYFVDTTGFCAAGPGGVKRIGDKKVNAWFLSRLGTNGLSSIEGAYDQERDVIRWRYSDGSDDTVFTDAIDYDLTLDEFVPVEEATSAIFTTGTPGYTMEELDAFGDMDSLTLSLDDRFWFGGVPQLGGMDENYKIGYFSGPPLAATFETNTYNFQRSMFVNRATPVSDSAGITIQVGQSDRLSDTLTFSAASSVLAEDGTVPLEARGLNLRYRANIPAADDWTYIRGLDALEMTPG